MLAAILVSGVLTTLSSAPAGTPAAAPIPVTARVPARTYYVGQAIELRIGAEAEGVRPEVVTPQVAGARVGLIDTRLSPLVSTAIGNARSERNLFITRFRLIADRAGVLKIPPVQVRLGSRAGASASLLIPVQNPPVAGRPAGFLGGVGTFALQSEASPPTVRVGQELTFSLLVTGPAARGMVHEPDLGRFSQVPLALQIHALPPVAADDPPSRRFRYRLRPTRAGTATLPPVAIAAFDPATERYMTRVTPGLPIRVVEVAPFDPATLDYPAQVSPQTLWRGVRPFLGVLLALVCAIGTLGLGRVLVVRWRVDPGRRLLRRWARLDPAEPAEQTARRITDALVEFFEQTEGRPRGELTPDEARRVIGVDPDRASLADGLARLITACDHARYSGFPQGSPALVTEARGLFAEIATDAGKKPGAEGRLETRGEIEGGAEKTRERQP